MQGTCLSHNMCHNTYVNHISPRTSMKKLFHTCKHFCGSFCALVERIVHSNSKCTLTTSLFNPFSWKTHRTNNTNTFSLRQECFLERARNTPLRSVSCFEKAWGRPPPAIKALFRRKRSSSHKRTLLENLFEQENLFERGTSHFFWSNPSPFFMQHSLLRSKKCFALGLKIQGMLRTRSCGATSKSSFGEMLRTLAKNAFLTRRAPAETFGMRIFWSKKTHAMLAFNTQESKHAWRKR